MWGPSLFAPQLRVLLDYMKINIELNMYHIFVILTDGCMHDLRDTVDVILECTNFPVSIIIIGVGDADFTAMEQLDSDDRLLLDGWNKEAQRDIVQFVDFNEFKDGTVINGDYLAEAVLQEVPD